MYELCVLYPEAPKERGWEYTLPATKETAASTAWYFCDSTRKVSQQQSLGPRQDFVDIYIYVYIYIYLAHLRLALFP